MTQSKTTLKTEFHAGVGIGTAAALTVVRGTGGHGEVIAFPVPGIGAEAEPPAPPPLGIANRMLEIQRMADISHGERTVLTVIAYHDGEGGAWPSIETIRKLSGGTCRRTVKGHLNALKTKGRLSWKHGKTTNLYTIHYSKQVVDNFPDCREIPTSVESPISEPDCREITSQTVGKSPPRTINKILKTSNSKPLTVNSDPTEQESLTESTSRDAQEILKHEAHTKLIDSAIAAVSPYRSVGPEVKVKDPPSLAKRYEKAKATPKATPTPKALPRNELEALATALSLKFEPDMSDAALTDAIRQGGYSGSKGKRKWKTTTRPE